MVDRGKSAEGEEEEPASLETHVQVHSAYLSPLPHHRQLRGAQALPTSVQFSSVQSLSRILLFSTPWTAALQASPSITNSQSLLKLMSIESVMPSSHLIFCHPLSSRLQSFLTSGSFQMSLLFTSGGQSIGVSASASVLPMTIQDWFPLGAPCS